MRTARSLLYAGFALIVPFVFGADSDPRIEQLHQAAQSGDLKQVEVLLGAAVPTGGVPAGGVSAGGLNVDARDSVGATPLHDAAWAGQTEVARFLIRKGANVNARHAEGGSTPLHHAVIMNHPEIVTMLIQRGADVNALYDAGKTPLYIAANRGYPQIVALLLAGGAKVNIRSEIGATALEEACWHGDAEIARLLIAHGADTNSPNPVTGVTPIHAAVMRGNGATVQALLDAGVPAGLRDPYGVSPLDAAVQVRRVDMIDLLVRRGAAAEVQKILSDAVLNDRIETVRLLITTLVPSGGALGSTTLLHDAALKGHVEILELLLGHGADVNSRNTQGATALHDAALAGERGAAEVLLQHGAEIDARDTESGATPLHRAASWGRLDVVELLLARGADPAIRDKNGRTPLDLAVANQQSQVTSVLKRKP